MRVTKRTKTNQDLTGTNDESITIVTKDQPETPRPGVILQSNRKGPQAKLTTKRKRGAKANWAMNKVAKLEAKLTKTILRKAA